MGKWNECYLCGGKLNQGRCMLCGLDNTKINRKNYRLNESGYEKKRIRADVRKDENLTEYAKETISKTAHKRAETLGGNSAKAAFTAGNAAKNIIMPKVSSIKNNMPGNRFEKMKTRKGIPTVGAIILVIAIAGIGGMVISGLKEFVSDDIWQGESYNESFDDYDPYTYVERDLSEEGDICDISLTNGEYIVGVSLPEGSYTVELSEGRGSLNVTDEENGIYLYKAFGPDEEYEVTSMDDLRLYEGAVVEVSTVKLELHSENAQTEAMTVQDNPLTETVQLKAGESYTAGVDFPEGIYDISGTEWGNIEYSVYLGEIFEEEELNYITQYVWFSGEDWSQIYYNAVLPAGTELTVGTEDVSLRPSEKVGSLDYDAYYDRYR